ncbi:MAG: DUF2934 domain-containing protein [Candidatus Thiodiazotropha sp.]
MSKTEAKVSKKKVAKKKVAANPATKKKASKKKAAVAAKAGSLISPRERYEMIATMAYYRAEQRNFEPGHDVEDWLDCERIIDQMMSN